MPRLAALYVAPEAGAPAVRVSEARALAGRGLAGDRYAAGQSAFSRWPGKGRALTLITAEALAAAEAEFGVAMRDGEHRLNPVVEGVPLANLRGVRFQIGEVEVEGVRWCAPCKYLVRVTSQDRSFEALVGRGGVRAEILTDGVIHEGDPVTCDPQATAHRPHLPG